MAKNPLGVFGEEYAAQVLVQKGYTILERNYYSRYGEIDIIAQNDKYTVFVEVKTRSEGCPYAPSQAVSLTKQKRFIKTVQSYYLSHPMVLQPRFDCIEIIAAQGQAFSVVSYNHMENAFITEEFYASV